MAKIVISYRRSDSVAIAGRICEHLRKRYGNDAVYMDVDSIPAGKDYRADIYSALQDAKVLLVIVGRKWLGTKSRGRYRVMEEDDPVRLEVQAALQRNILVVPVLVDGAEMPDPTTLPASLKTFPFLNAAIVGSGADFHQHFARLVHHLHPFIRPKRHWHQASAAVLALTVVLVAAAWWFKLPPTILQSERGMGGPFEPFPPPGRSHWSVDKSTVFLEATGSKRQFFFIEPTGELAGQGARPGSLLFDGRKTGNAAPYSYEGSVFIFAGRCGTREYPAIGPITNDDETVTLVGNAPRLDPVSCEKIDDQERTLVFNYKRNSR